MEFKSIDKIVVNATGEEKLLDFDCDVSVISNEGTETVIFVVSDEHRDDLVKTLEEVQFI